MPTPADEAMIAELRDTFRTLTEQLGKVIVAQDAGRSAGGNAGVSRDGGRALVPFAAAVFRAGNAEPDRAGGDVSIARSPTRSLHVPNRRCLSEPRRRAGDHEANDVRPRAAS